MHSRFRHGLGLFGIICLVSLCLLDLPSGQAATSTNFDVNQERGGPIEYQGSSANYDIKAEIGHPGVGSSSSTNYIYDHGTIWLSGATGVSVTVRWAVPESRVGSAMTNDDSTFYLEVRPPSSTAAVAWSPGLALTAEDGTYATSTAFDLSDGTYDVAIKTDQHLSKVVHAVTLSSATTTVLNFTGWSNGPGYGPDRLLAGDISAAGNSTSTLGDNVVNSVDLSILIPKLDVDDPTGNAERPNLNQDVVINSVDLSLMIKNLDLVGQ